MRPLALMILLLSLTACAAASPALPATPAATPPVLGCLVVSPLIRVRADDLDPRWSPDGSRIAFVGHMDGNPEIYVADATSGRPAYATNISNSPLDDYAPRWSPDGRHIAYLHREAQNTWQPVQIRIAAADGGQQQIVTPGYETRTLLGWMRGGALLAYRDRNAYYVYDLDRQDSRRLYDIAEGVFTAPGPISPDGRRLFLGAVIQGTDSQVYVADADTGDVRLTDLAHFQHLPPLTWSPDSRRAALVTNDRGGVPGLWLVDAGDGSVTRLDTAADRERMGTIAWAADGRLVWVVYASNEVNAPLSTVYMAAPGGEPRALFSIHHNIGDILWSPSQNHFVFNTFAGLYIADPETGRFSELMQGIGGIWRVGWSHDGRYLAVGTYGNPRGSYVGTAILDLQTGARVYFGDVGWLAWSPVANRLLLNVRGDDGADIDSLDLCEMNEE